jgi:hypothetical protein
MTLFALVLSPLALHAQQDEVLAPVQQMFAGMTRRDASAIKAAALPGATLTLMREGKPESMTIETFADHFSRPSKLSVEERIKSPLVRVDHDLAVVWAPFELRVDGKLDHCGTDLFSLVRVSGKWVIAAIADTSSNDCSSK